MRESSVKGYVIFLIILVFCLMFYIGKIQYQLGYSRGVNSVLLNFKEEL